MISDLMIMNLYRKPNTRSSAHRWPTKPSATRESLLSFPIILSLVSIILTLIRQSDAYLTTLDAHSEDCFYEKALASTKLGFTFEVIEGGFLDIDVTIFDSDGALIHKEPKASSGKYTIEASKEGHYKYCFSNKMSTVTPKVVMFNIETARQVQHKLSGAQDHDRLAEMVKSVTDATTAVKHELEYLSVRDRIHRRINDLTNSRVVTWTWIELLILLGVSFGQVMYIKRFFEVRRAI
uniref:Transmembrane emp24 domain-containing protein n=1 Tax=Aceria tosichella TaxID=561515 RepID=A0A6G1SG60_9ACAR